ncbi:MAG: hypothetical protein E7K04_03785 [Helicobacter sp.]|nr:hypothetical protein [Helicobacter sp.]
MKYLRFMIFAIMLPSLAFSEDSPAAQEGQNPQEAQGSQEIQGAQEASF